MESELSQFVEARPWLIGVGGAGVSAVVVAWVFELRGVSILPAIGRRGGWIVKQLTKAINMFEANQGFFVRSPYGAIFFRERKKAILKV